MEPILGDKAGTKGWVMHSQRCGGRGTKDNDELPKHLGPTSGGNMGRL